MCCPGCQAVAQAIVDNGLVNYYEFRTEPAARGDAALANTMSQLAVYDEPELQEEFVFDEGKHKQIQLTVEGITCAACGWLIEKQLAKVAGIKQVSVNVSSRRASVSWDNEALKLSGILSKLKSIGYESLPFQADNHEASYKKEQKSYLKKLGLAGIMTMQVMMIAMGQYFDILGNIDADAIAYFNAISLLLTTPVVLYSGSIFYVSALKAIQAKSVNMDVPITIAILATYIAGVMSVNASTGEVYFESICMFVFFLLISRFLEHRSRHRATLISSNMLKLIPVTANKKSVSEGTNQGSEAWTAVLAKQLEVGDIVLVKAGETVPIDGSIIEGKSTFDESMLTGEFEPVTKQVGQNVFAGSVNQQGAITLKVNVTVKHAMMNEIIRLQEMAMGNKPKIAAVADVLSRYFVFAVLLISALTYTYWYLQDDPHAFWITISVLVATCPCALGLATPSALTCAMAKLNQMGVLLKRADALEQITQTTDLVFDKTGTLTEGKFSIQARWINSQIAQNCYQQFFAGSSKDIDEFTEDELNTFVLALSHAVEQRSEHPISVAFAREYDESASSSNNNKLKTLFDMIVLQQIKIEIGKGISAQIKLGRNDSDTGQESTIKMGSAKFVLNSQGESKGIQDEITGANVLLSIDDVVLAAFWVTDTVRDDAINTIAKLKQKRLQILSGDTQNNVEDVASILNIEHSIGDSTPSAKLAYIKSLQQSGKRAIMLGDGINDAPVLAAADVSVAVGNASDLAKNAADVVLLNPKLSSLVDLIEMAARTKQKIKQNIAWALSYNLLVLPFAVSGLLTPWQAALGMSLSSIIVVYNSTRLMR
jgi:Cu2+-exporting ATPase